MINLIKLFKSKKYIDEIEVNYNQMNPTNWRTTTSGVIAALIQLAKIWVPPAKQPIVDGFSALFVALGLYHATDSATVKDSARKGVNTETTTITVDKIDEK